MVEIKTQGMHCKSCEMLVVDALEDAGIVATANAKKNIVTINDESVDIEKAKQIIKDEGF